MLNTYCVPALMQSLPNSCSSHPTFYRLKIWDWENLNILAKVIQLIHGRTEIFNSHLSDIKDMLFLSKLSISQKQTNAMLKAFLQELWKIIILQIWLSAPKYIKILYWVPFVQILSTDTKLYVSWLVLWPIQNYLPNCIFEQ